MSARAPAVRPLAGFDGVSVLRSGKLSSAAVCLTDGGLCLYSPLRGLTGDTVSALQGMGDVSFLLAPNHYHHLGLPDAMAQFPDAVAISSPDAAPRLAKQTGLRFEGLDGLMSRLPPNVTMLMPDGLKMGEVWLQVTSADAVAWIVCDAFSSAQPVSQDFADMPGLLGTFPRYGVGDRAVYGSWVREEIARAKPTVLVPCHGAPVRRPDLGEHLIALIDEQL